MEPVAVIDGVEYINNSMCTNVDASVRSVEAMEKPTVIIAGGKHKGGDITLMAKALASRAKHLVLIGQSADLIESAVRAEGFSLISRAETLPQAVDVAKLHAEPGDAVLLSPGCASFDMFSGFEERGRIFKEAVKNYQGDGRGR
jgi:UDP-N-acetylmuramoylalanine--D-glutamate ligase